MSFTWRRDVALVQLSDWWERLDRKNRQPGTSAPTLAVAWAGPLAVTGALATQPALEGLVIERVEVEAQARVDGLPGGRRNHDLLLEGRVGGGDKVVVCVEAKAGEPLGATVGEQLRAAAKAKEKKASSGALERVEGLLERFAGHLPADDATVLGLRYQLLTALAGTLHDADSRQAQDAVLLVHEFLTDGRPDNKVPENDRALGDFARVVFDCELPAGARAPWCMPVRLREEHPAARLYLARAVTDMRTKTLLEIPVADGA